MDQSLMDRFSYHALRQSRSQLAELARNRREFARMADSLQCLGYEAVGYADYRQSVDDREICERATCPQCGQRGMRYRPFLHLTTRDYRAYAVCPECNFAEEF